MTSQAKAQPPEASRVVARRGSAFGNFTLRVTRAFRDDDNRVEFAVGELLQAKLLLAGKWSVIARLSQHVPPVRTELTAFIPEEYVTEVVKEAPPPVVADPEKVRKVQNFLLNRFKKMQDNAYLRPENVNNFPKFRKFRYIVFAKDGKPAGRPLEESEARARFLNGTITAETIIQPVQFRRTAKLSVREYFPDVSTAFTVPPKLPGYFIKNPRGEIHGPVELAQMRRLFEMRCFAPDTMVRATGEQTWCKLSDLVRNTSEPLFTAPLPPLLSDVDIHEAVRCKSCLFYNTPAPRTNPGNVCVLCGADFTAAVPAAATATTIGTFSIMKGDLVRPAKSWNNTFQKDLIQRAGSRGTVVGIDIARNEYTVRWGQTTLTHDAASNQIELDQSARENHRVRVVASFAQVRLAKVDA